ncbi:hypothetical protein HK104_007679, partial [Borealophlyctis nickersoniae]
MRLKRLKIQEERLYDIERKNHILLDRIAFQMVNPCQVSDLHQARRIREVEAVLGGTGSGTLHGPKRRQDMLNIQSENMTILQRIEDKAPYYNRDEWLRDRRRNLEYLANIAQYPLPYYRALGEVTESGEYIPKRGGASRPCSRFSQNTDARRSSSSSSPSLSLVHRNHVPPAAAPGGRPVTRHQARRPSHEDDEEWGDGGSGGYGMDEDEGGSLDGGGTETSEGGVSLEPDVREVELPPPGEMLPNGRPPTRPNQMIGPLSDDDEEVVASPPPPEDHAGE